jgi:ubiquinone biosynthesis protein
MRGELAIRFTHGGIEGFIRQMERSTNRLSFSIVIAALIIGSSLIFQSGLGPALFGYPLLGLIGFLIASILGVWLLIGILRSGTL